MPCTVFAEVQRAHGLDGWREYRKGLGVIQRTRNGNEGDGLRYEAGHPRLSFWWLQLPEDCNIRLALIQTQNYLIHNIYFKIGSWFSARLKEAVSECIKHSEFLSDLRQAFPPGIVQDIEEKIFEWTKDPHNLKIENPYAEPAAQGTHYSLLLQVHFHSKLQRKKRIQIRLQRKVYFFSLSSHSQ